MKEEMEGMTKFMPSYADKIDGTKVIPAAVETPTKSCDVMQPLPKERLKAVKTWKPKGRK